MAEPAPGSPPEEPSNPHGVRASFAETEAAACGWAVLLTGKADGLEKLIADGEQATEGNPVKVSVRTKKGGRSRK